ncbi:hypothetical protein CM15mP35_01450 [bacterium]|nr:MAG: hypothetical protein CM15mP35_01450 [bacterium]
MMANQLFLGKIFLGTQNIYDDQLKDIETQSQKFRKIYVILIIHYFWMDCLKKNSRHNNRFSF